MTKTAQSTSHYHVLSCVDDEDFRPAPLSLSLFLSLLVSPSLSLSLSLALSLSLSLSPAVSLFLSAGKQPVWGLSTRACHELPWRLVHGPHGCFGLPKWQGGQPHSCQHARLWRRRSRSMTQLSNALPLNQTCQLVMLSPSKHA